MRRFLKRSALCVGLGLALTVLIVNFTLPRRNSKWADFEKIKPGMTKAEVESIMGETEIYFPTISLGGPHSLGWNVDATLFSDEYCLVAKFDRKWKVTETRCCPVEASYFRRVGQSLGW
jgi:hypothetical protein